MKVIISEIILCVKCWDPIYELVPEIRLCMKRWDPLYKLVPEIRLCMNYDYEELRSPLQASAWNKVSFQYCEF